MRVTGSVSKPQARKIPRDESPNGPDMNQYTPEAPKMPVNVMKLQAGGWSTGDRGYDGLYGRYGRGGAGDEGDEGRGRDAERTLT